MAHGGEVPHPTPSPVSSIAPPTPSATAVLVNKVTFYSEPTLDASQFRSNVELFFISEDDCKLHMNGDLITKQEVNTILRLKFGTADTRVICEDWKKAKAESTPTPAPTPVARK